MEYDLKFFEVEYPLEYSLFTLNIDYRSDIFFSKKNFDILFPTNVEISQ